MLPACALCFGRAQMWAWGFFSLSSLFRLLVAKWTSVNKLCADCIYLFHMLVNRTDVLCPRYVCKGKNHSDEPTLRHTGFCQVSSRVSCVYSLKRFSAQTTILLTPFFFRLTQALVTAAPTVLSRVRAVSTRRHERVQENPGMPSLRTSPLGWDHWGDDSVQCLWCGCQVTAAPGKT